MTTDPNKQQHYTSSPPVNPYPEFLPLGDPNLPWDRFEAFCEEFISRLPGVKETHRYGRTGSRQRGIDIFADLDNGERWAFQCRQWQKVTKTDATKAIQQTTYRADHFILTLSCLASSDVRNTCESYSDWDVWDAGDISRKVRELEMHSGARLVESHFGASWRKSYLGLHGLSPFVTPTEFFRLFSNSSALFNHAWELVGRTDHLREAHEFVESKEQKVAILRGRGGIGKSKILHELAERFHTEHKGMALWFAAEGVPLTPDGADYLPFQPCVIVVDDAHRRDDLPALLALSQQRPHVTKLFLSCRPDGIDYLKSRITQSGFDSREFVVLSDVKELSREEVTELGRQALSPEFAILAEKLAAATWDCPLVTVVGGQLIAEKAIDPELLERDEEFRDTVLVRFRDILIGKIGDRIDTELCKSLLNMIAAVQPIRLDDEQVLDCQAEFLGTDCPTLLSSLGILEEAGVLLRRGYTLRIVPDVLADHILHQANVSPQGILTKYADRVFGRFASLCPSEVLRNLSELDWRLKRSDAQAPDLLGNIWQSIEQEFQAASSLGRGTILGILEKVAVHQPERTLKLVEYAIRSPATESECPERHQFYEYTHSNVLRGLPTILRQISYTLDFLPRCCELLWQLGRDDNRDLNRSPDHAMNVLASLGSYEVGKPFIVTRGVLDTIEKLLEDPSCHDHVHSPLDIINPMLAKTGFSVHVEGPNFVYRPFTLDDESIKSIRQRSIFLVGHCLFSRNLRISLRALEILESALDEPHAILDMEISDEDRDQWRPEQLEILTLIEGLIQRSTEPVILIRIRKALWWHRNYSPSDEVRNMAVAVVSSMSESFELRLTQGLMSPFHIDDWPSIEDNGIHDNNIRQEKSEQMLQALAFDFRSHSKTTDEAYEILTDRIQAIDAAGVQSNPQVFLTLLGNSNPEFAAALCDMIVDNPNDSLAQFLHSLLASVRIWSAERARDIGQRALKGGSEILCCGIAKSYQSRRWADNADAEDIKIIEKLLDHEDSHTRGETIGSLRALAQSRPKDAIALAKGVEVGENAHLAKELCQLFSEGYGVPFRELTSDDLKSLLSKFEDVQEIDDYHINTFLVKASEQDARAVVSLLLTRIRKNDDKRAEYHPLPILRFRHPLAGLATDPERETILRAIRDASLEPWSSVKYWVPKLLREASLDFDSAVSLKVLDEWINSGNTDRIKSAARLVSSAGPALVFKHVGFVVNLLERAYAADSDCYQSVTRDLERSALSGTRSGTPGQPRPQDLDMGDKASEAKSNFDAGSPPYRFYNSLVNIAEASIKADLLRDEERFE